MENEKYSVMGWDLGFIELLNEDFEVVATTYEDGTTTMGNRPYSYESFKALVKATTGCDISWKWDDIYEMVRPEIVAS